jgi:hypothetical protein
MVDFQMMKHYKDRADEAARQYRFGSDNQSMSRCEKVRLALVIALVIVLMGSLLTALALASHTH